MERRDLTMRTMVLAIMVALDALATPVILLSALAAPEAYVANVVPVADAVDGAALLFKLVTMIVFAWWIHTAGRNLLAAGYEDLEFSPASRIWWFAVPFANFVKPFQGMRELWNASHGNSDYTQGSGLVATWWALWLGSRLSRLVANGLAGESDSGTGPFWVEAAFDVPLAIVAILLIRGIARAQKQLAEPALVEVFA